MIGFMKKKSLIPFEEVHVPCDSGNIARQLIVNKIKILSIRCKYATGGEERWLGKVSRKMNKEIEKIYLDQ